MCISVVSHLQFSVISIFWQVQNPVKIPTSSLITKLRYQKILHQLPRTIQIFSREFPTNLTYFFSIIFSYHWHNANLKKKRKSAKTWVQTEMRGSHSSRNCPVHENMEAREKCKLYTFPKNISRNNVARKY